MRNSERFSFDHFGNVFVKVGGIFSWNTSTRPVRYARLLSHHHLSWKKKIWALYMRCCWARFVTVSRKCRLFPVAVGAAKKKLFPVFTWICVRASKQIRRQYALVEGAKRIWFTRSFTVCDSVTNNKSYKVECYTRRCLWNNWSLLKWLSNCAEFAFSDLIFWIIKVGSYSSVALESTQVQSLVKVYWK